MHAPAFELLEQSPSNHEIYHVFLQLKASLKGCKFSFHEELIETVYAWYADEHNLFFF